MSPRRLVTLGLLLVLSGVALAGCHHETQRRFQTAHARLDAQCAAFRAAERDVLDPCDLHATAPKVIPIYREAQADVKTAKTALAAKDKEAAVSSLQHALDKGETPERTGTLLGALVSAGIVKDVLDVIEADKANGANSPTLGSEDVRAVLAHARLHGVERTLDANRLSRLSLWAASSDKLWLRPVSEAIAADMMEQNELALEDMRRAILANDEARCNSAVARERDVWSSRELDHVTCGKMVNIMRIQARLEKARA